MYCEVQLGETKCTLTVSPDIPELVGNPHDRKPPKMAVNHVCVDFASTYHDGNPPQNKCADVRSSLGNKRAIPAG